MNPCTKRSASFAILQMVALCLLSVTAARGQCTTNTSDGKAYFTALTSFQPAAFSVRVPNGTVLAEQNASYAWSNFTGSRPTLRCTSYYGAMRYYAIGDYNPTYNTFATSIAGIGMQLQDGIFLMNSNGFTIGNTAITAGATENLQWSSTSLKLRLIKTGPITASGSITGAFVEIRAGFGNGPVLAKLQFDGSVPIRPKIPTCKATATELAVTMVNATLPVLRNNGKAPSKEFTIELSCGGGENSTFTDMYLQLDDVSMPANTSTLLTLQPEKDGEGRPPAGGVAIEILRVGRPVQFGTPWYVGTFRDGPDRPVITNLQAHYVKTSDNITLGHGKARASFTISYQ